MNHLKMPHNEETAVEILLKFMELALHTNLKDHFLKAAHILYGASLTIKEDLSNRMLFFCTLCRKEMNNIRSLSEHSKSGTHIKNVDDKNQQTLPSKKTVSKNFHPNTLQYKIANSSCPILGCQMIEAYETNRRPIYYKCILCSAHGKMEAMYYHVIGDKHTDKYIKSRIILKNLVAIDSESRSYLRTEIEKEESYTVENIRTIQGEKYYPYNWEKEGKANKYHSHSLRLNCTNFSPKAESIPDVKKDEDDCETKEALKFSPVAARGRKENIQGDKSLQVYSYGFLDSIFKKMNFIVHTHLMKKFDLQSTEDLKVALNLLNYALHHLYFVNRAQLMEGKTHQLVELREQKQAIESCLGYVFERMLQKYFKNMYGNWQYEI